tara:strand:- start:317 stop:610 length:294 start_codon:yes stop_codon:yes gene_type:complete
MPFLTQTQNILLLIFTLINLYTFFAMAYDKRKAIKSHGHRRTPEGYIFFLASMFGAIGVYASMHLFRHKSRKWYFQIGIPVLVVQNLATLYMITTFL